jgi:hypothetical protein
MALCTKAIPTKPNVYQNLCFLSQTNQGAVVNDGTAVIMYISTNSNIYQNQAV